MKTNFSIQQNCSSMFFFKKFSFYFNSKKKLHIIFNDDDDFDSNLLHFEIKIKVFKKCKNKKKRKGHAHIFDI